jgi:2'-hydroxyisoflavone reductase
VCSTCSTLLPPPAWGASPKKILVLGGTLFLGPALVDALTAEGHTVTLFNRGITNPDLFPHLAKLRGFRSPDVRDQDLTALAHRSFDAIVDVWPNDPNIVAPAALFLKDKAPHYLFVSSIATYDSKEFGTGNIVAEDATMAAFDGPGRAYARNKAESERRLHTIIGEPLTIVRPGPIKGDRDDGLDLLTWLLRAQAGGEHIAPDDGSDPVQFVDVKDVARFLVMTIERSLYGTFNLTAKSLTFRDFLDACKGATRSDALFTWIPQRFLHEHGLDPDDLQHTFAGYLPFWRPKGSAPGPGLYRVSNAKALGAGWKTRPFEETAFDALHYFYSSEIEPRKSLTAEKEKEILEAWRRTNKSSSLKPKTTSSLW